jgi:hypothetical protein
MRPDLGADVVEHLAPGINAARIQHCSNTACNSRTMVLLCSPAGKHQRHNMALVSNSSSSSSNSSSSSLMTYYFVSPVSSKALPKPAMPR